MKLDFLRSFVVSSVVVAPVLVLVSTLGACTTSKYRDVRFTPAPAEVEVRAESVAGSQVRALASILGVARADAKAGHGEQVETRLRLENLGTVDARIERDALALLSADLVPFSGPVLAPDVDLNVPAGQTRTLDVVFTVPDGSRNWNGLNLRFVLTFRDVRATAGVTFERVVVNYYPYPYDEPVHWHFGFHYGHYW